MKKFCSLLLIIAISMLCSCVKTIDFPKNQRGDVYYHRFDWTYQGHHFQMELSFLVSTYDFYNTMPKDLDYLQYTAENPERPYLRYVVSALKHAAKDYHFDDEEMAEYVLSFIQSVPYAYDPGGYGYNRHAILTLMDFQGDCVDHAVAYISIMSNMGYWSSIFLLPSAHHMAAGVEVPNCTYGGYAGPSGRIYRFAECTSSKWHLGANSFPHDSIIMYEVKPVHGHVKYVHQPDRTHWLKEVSVTAARRHPQARMASLDSPGRKNCITAKIR